MVDSDATVAAPGASSYEREEAAGRASSGASKNADILGKVFAKRFGDCALGPSDKQDLVENAKGRAGSYSLEAGSRRYASRVGAPNTRAARSVRDVPESMESPKWCVFEAFCWFRPPRPRRVPPYRSAEGPPMSESLRGSLLDEGFVRQYDSRASALV